MFRRKKTGIPRQPLVPPMPNPNPNYKPPVGLQREEKRMFGLSECKYYAPCGLCTFHNIECAEYRKRKAKNKNLCNNQPSEPEDSLMAYIKSGKGLPPLDTNYTDLGYRIDKRG